MLLPHGPSWKHRHLSPPNDVLQLIQGNSKELSDQKGYTVHPACFWSPSNGTCLENIQREIFQARLPWRPRRHPDQKPEQPQLSSFNVREYQLLPGDRDLHRMSKAASGNLRHVEDHDHRLGGTANLNIFKTIA